MQPTAFSVTWLLRYSKQLWLVGLVVDTVKQFIAMWGYMFVNAALNYVCIANKKGMEEARQEIGNFCICVCHAVIALLYDSFNVFFCVFIQVIHVRTK